MLDETPQGVSAIDKIMQQVKAAQSDVKSQRIEVERKSVRPQKFDGALGRISQALTEATAQKIGIREPSIFDVMAMPPVRYSPEIFDTTGFERPQSPRVWKTFTVKLAHHPTSPVILHARRQREFEDPFTPAMVHSSSWNPPKSLRLPQGMLREAYLQPPVAKGNRIVVKVSRLHLPSDPPVFDVSVPGEGHESLPASTPVASDRNSADSWRRAASSDTKIVADLSSDLAPILEEEDSATVRFEDLSDELPVIRVALPRMSDGLPNVAPLLSPEASRFKTYGPKLPENSTVAFRRGLSAVTSTEPASTNMFMVSSEIGTDHTDPNLADEIASHAEQVSNAVGENVLQALSQSSPSSAPQLLSPDDRRLSPSLGQSFPTLSSQSVARGSQLDATAHTEIPSPYAPMRKEDIPKHVAEELERLNARVSSVSTITFDFLI